MGSQGKLFGILLGVFFLVIILSIVADVVAQATNVTGIAATVLDFLPAIVAVLALWLLMRDAGVISGKGN